MLYFSTHTTVDERFFDARPRNTDVLRNSDSGWGWPARYLHWLMAILMIAQVTLGQYAHDLETSPQKLGLMMWHKSLGITLLLLAILRLGWALFNTRPSAPSGSGRWQRRAARASHMTLYGLMLAIPLSGWLHNSAANVPFKLYRLVPWPSLIGPSEQLAHVFEEWHEGLVKALLALLAVHVGAALWHHFGKRDDILRRMLSGPVRS